MLLRADNARYITALMFAHPGIVLGPPSAGAQPAAWLDVRLTFSGAAPAFETSGSRFDDLFNRLGQVLVAVTGIALASHPMP